MGTLLILAMTTILFSTIVIWVSNIPPPPASTKLDMEGSYSPIFLGGNGANITLRHKGGEDVAAADMRVYITITRADIPSTTALAVKGGTYATGPLTGRPYGLVDGQDATWNIGERWQWSNYSTLPTDTISAILVDLARNRVMWSGDVLGAPGTHPPIFLEKWADRVWTTPTPDTPWTGTPFHVMARMADADNDLVRVDATMTIYFGTPDPCASPQSMTDDGTNGDQIPGDGVWTLYRTCMDSPTYLWDGSVVLFNATDAMGHYATSRLVLRVIPNPGGAPGGGGTPDSGRPPNLLYNGLQGFNIFNSTEWAMREFFAAPTRTFKENEQVVVVIASLVLTNSQTQNHFVFHDPFSGIPGEPVVYGLSKTVTLATKPSNNQAFSFYKFVNGYNVFIYTFDLNNPSTVGTNFFLNPAHPPNYFFGSYPLTMAIVDSTGTQFVASDSINVTDLAGTKRAFPVVQTFVDSAFTNKGNLFQSTDVIYVQVSFQDTGPVSSIVMGNVMIRDFRGGTQVLRAPINGRDADPPLCPVTGACSGPIFSAVGVPFNLYRFAINLSRADQDPWVDGTQSYSLIITSIRDGSTYDRYSNLALAITVVAPLYKLDLVLANTDTVNSAWGTHDFSYVYTAVNGIDRWRKERLLTGTPSSPSPYTKAVKFLDFDRDSDLDIAASVVNWDGFGNQRVFLFRQDLDTFGNPVFTRFPVGSVSSVTCNDVATGDVTADGFPEIVCGGSDGAVWYYRHDGTWKTVNVDTSRTGGSKAVNVVDVGDFNGDGANDIAVGRLDGKVTYYLNLDGQGGFANIAADDNWFPESELLAIGFPAANTYLQTFLSDDVRESIREATVTEGSVGGSTANPDFVIDAAWTYADWEAPSSAIGEYHATGGNTSGYADVHMAPASGLWVSGYWYQGFTVNGSGPWDVTMDVGYRFVQKGALFNQVRLYAFVDPSPGIPVLGEEVWAATLTDIGGWTTSGPISAGSRITGLGTYYLKIVARTLHVTGGGAPPTIVGFDDVALTWTSSPGPVSELNHYWRIQQLPNRPSSTYRLHLEGLRSVSPDGDDAFSLAYAVGSLAGPPADTSFLTVITIAAVVETSYETPLPDLGGDIVWVRVTDTDRFVGNIDNDTVSIDRLYIRVQSTGGPTGADIDLASGSVTAICAGDQQPDGFVDLAVGATGEIFRLLGSPGGLINMGLWHTQGTSAITGIDWINGTAAYPGLELAFSTGTNVYVITGSGLFAPISGPLAAPGGNPIAALRVGDVDGDGDGDIVIATGGVNIGAVRYWRNLGGATAWDRWPEGINVDDLGKQIYDLDLGDMSNAAYLGG